MTTIITLSFNVNIVNCTTNNLNKLPKTWMKTHDVNCVFIVYFNDSLSCLSMS